MKKALVFGAKERSVRLRKRIEQNYSIIGYLDNDSQKWGKFIDNKPIMSLDDINSVDYEAVVIATFSSPDSVVAQLIDLGVDENIIDLSFINQREVARKQFLEDIATVIYEHKINGNVAEAGVFQGEFAAKINKAFPDKKLYLFDTFEGFDERDIVIEAGKGFSEEKQGHLSNTSEQVVMDKMIYPDNCIIVKGYFPESAQNIDDVFCFVNLDMDLYQPTYEGLEFFWDKMQKNGIIVVHDYFADSLVGVKAAVDEWCEANQIVPFPIGDSISIAVQKK